MSNKDPVSPREPWGPPQLEWKVAPRRAEPMPALKAQRWPRLKRLLRERPEHIEVEVRGRSTPKRQKEESPGPPPSSTGKAPIRAHRPARTGPGLED